MESATFAAERKLMAERSEPAAEALKLERGYRPAPCQSAPSGTAAAAAFSGRGPSS